MVNIRPGRLAVAVALVASCVALGLSAPLVFDFEASELKLSNVAVFAAPRDGHEITAPVDIATQLRLHLKRGTIELDAPEGATASDAEALPRNGSAKLIIDGGAFQLAGAGGERRDSAPLTGPVATLIAAVRALNFDTLLIRRGVVDIVLPDGGMERLSDVFAEARASRGRSLTVRGTGRLRGREVAFDLSATMPSGEAAGSRVPVKLRLKSPLLDATFDGRVGASETLHMQGRMKLAMEDVRATARWLGAEWPSGPGLKKALIEGEFEWQKPALAFDKSTFRLDGNQATGTLTLSFAGKRPTLTGTLALQSLDLGPYFSENADNARIAGLLSWSSADKGSLSMPLGRSLDADIRASASRLQIGDLAFGRFAASLSLKEGRLLADIAEIGLEGGGRGSGQLTAVLESDPPQIAVRAKLEDIDAARASAALLGHIAVQGLCTIALDVTSEGESLAELVDAVRGKLVLNLVEGGRLGIDVKALREAARKGELAGWGSAARGQTSVENLEARLRVDKGIVASELVEATAGSNLLRAIGTISLRSRQMDLRLLLDAIPETAEKEIPSDVLVFRGPWTAPSITVER